MEWTREKTLCLINEYRKRRGLWDMTHDDYRKKEMKQKLLVETSEALGGNIPINEIEKKFHTLRTQYHREINRMKRKDPYNSKWFGFKNLQFLSSPKACRSNKGRIKSEITEEGIVTTKYIIRETHHDNSRGSPNSCTNINEDYVAIQRKPAITYEAIGNTSNAVAQSIRTRELEKLIEETTKDVDEVEASKPKMAAIKEIIPIEIHAANATATAEITAANVQTTFQRLEVHHHEDQSMEGEEGNIETIDITQNETADINYPTTTTSVDANAMHTQHAIPTHRIIKIQRPDTCNDDEEYYGDSQQQQAQHHQIQAIPTSSTKRIYFENNIHQHSLLSAPSSTSQPNSTPTILKSLSNQQQENCANTVASQQTTSSPQQPNLRDEYSTYGEYVANEMREITNREILIGLKHKINTALFEASMAELQK